MTLEDALPLYQGQVNAVLDRWLQPAETEPQRLHEAMRYAVLGEGKRIRPVLVYATGQALEASLIELDGAAAAVELIHAYSLIHDDLPAMDDDDLRRGRPTCHRRFDEATAILAGDALQALAFYVLAHDRALRTRPEHRIAMIETLALASGSLGMAGGQAIDLASVGNRLTLAQLENMHLYKTGALISASVKLAYLASGTRDPAVVEGLDRYARCIGLAFQVQDDILDVEGETAVIGKPQGSDTDRNKPTYPNILGMAAAKDTARALCAQAIDSLAPLGRPAATLREIAEYIVRRDR